MNPLKGTFLGCAVLEEEVRGLETDAGPLNLCFLPPGLHRDPALLRATLQRHIDEAYRETGLIVLGYGLCGRGTEGLRARGLPLVVPKCHDCISFFVGGPDSAELLRLRRPRAYFLSTSWMRLGMDPLSLVEGEYTLRLGRSEALRAMRRELAHYTHIIYIRSPLQHGPSYRERARENARLLGKQFEEVEGSLDYLKRLLLGPHSRGEFLRVPPGGTVPLWTCLGQEDPGRPPPPPGDISRP
jgi:hypothetical protein